MSSLNFVFHKGFVRMSDEQKKDIEKRADVRKPIKIAPTSDGRLTAVQREARELYRPSNESGTEGGRRRGGVFDSAELRAVRDGNEAVSMSNLLSENALGIARLNRSRAQIERSFTGGGNRYVMGAEFAIVAIVALAGIAKRRADLDDSQFRVIAGLDDFEGEVIYQSPRLKNKLRAPNPFKQENSDCTASRSGTKSVRSERRSERSQNAGMRDGLFDPLGAYSKNVPDWMVSLDNSVAKEAGYLFNSVLRRPTVIMTMSDTFVSLAEQHFFDAVLAWLIVDLNKHIITEMWKGTSKVVAISNGEVVELPVWEDIVEFYQNKPKDARADNLLTVVLKRNLDRELIEDMLASVVVPGDATIVCEPPVKRELVQNYRVTVRGISVRIHRFIYENYRSWHLMEKHLQSERCRRFL